MEQKSQMDEGDNRPVWLTELENRKRKPQLAHEIGAGALCIKCTGACPGLDLHFWRKICKNCKCSRDDHDVPNDEFPQFKLLFGSANKSISKKFIVLKMNKQQVDHEETFEWAPPDTTKELAADYMKALPKDKLPIKGSTGAALRKQQLQKQLPLHDIDHKMCDELSDSERKQFEKYLENLKKYVGLGKVSKIGDTQQFNELLTTPVNASECSSPMHKPSIKNHPPTNLWTPCNFTSKSVCPSESRKMTQSYNPNNGNNASVLDSNPVPSRLENYSTPHFEQTASQQLQPGRYHHELEKIQNDGQHITESTNIVGNFHNPATIFSSTHKSFHKENDAINEMTRTEGNKTVDGNVKYARDNINENSMTNVAQTNLPIDISQNIHNLPILSNLQKLDSEISDKLASKQNSTKIPQYSNPSKYQSEEFPYDLLDKNLAKTSAIQNDIIGSTLDQDGLSNIRKKLMAKYSKKDEPAEHLPLHDYGSPSIPHDFRGGTVDANNYNVPSVPSFNSDTTSKPLQAKMNSYGHPDNTIIRSGKTQNPIFPNKAVGTSKMFVGDLESVIDNLSINESEAFKTQKCHGCNEKIHIGDVIVTAEKVSNAVWHPGCFACCTCNELLVDLVYFYYKGKLYCARDLASLMEIPRCFACDELIFVCEYTVAEGHNYHVKHFCCWDCDVPLAGKQYVSENDRPLCLNCFQKSYAKSCCACNNVIAANQQGVAIKNLDFHATDECFCCYNCKKSLLNGKMAVKENKLFCSRECIATHFNKNIHSS